MKKAKLKKLFAEIKEKAGLDFANVCASDYGDCCTCAWAEIGSRYPNGSGIFGKYWEWGMNKGKPISKTDELWIAHDITPEQAKILVDVCIASGYNITPKEYDEDKCFCISEINK